MPNTVKKIISSILLLSILFGNFFVGVEVLAHDNNENFANVNTDVVFFKELETYINRNITVKNNEISLSNREDVINFISEKIKDTEKQKKFITKIDFLFEQFNVNLKNNKDIHLTKDGYGIDYTSFERSSSHIVTYHWYGVRHEFTNDWAARDFAHSYEQAAVFSATGAGLGASISGFPPAWIPTAFLTASAGYNAMVANCIKHNADKPGDGVILVFNWWLQFSCNPR